MANEQTRGMTDFATHSDDGTGDLRDRAREAAHTVKERAGERIESRIADSKSRAAETLSGVASTLMSSSQQLRGEQPGASRAIERAAEGVERFATYLQETNVDDVVDSVHEFARRQPAAFIGGAFALGFIASRFLKATSPHGRTHNLPAVTSDAGRGYAASYDTSRSYEPRSDGAGGSARPEDLGDGSPGLNRVGGYNAGSR